jgi:hypothetical protein
MEDYIFCVLLSNIACLRLCFFLVAVAHEETGNFNPTARF